jgi:hypothetical protein
MVTHTAQDISALTAYLVRRNQPRPCRLVAPGSDTLAMLLHRYPFLYNQIKASQQDYVASEQFQQRMQAKFEIRLSRYMIEKTRRSASDERSDLLTALPIINPTLLSDFGVKTSLERFTGAVWGTETHRDLAHRFLAETQADSFGAFKQHLYSYLIASLPVTDRTQRFKEQLRIRLESFMEEQNDQTLNSFLVQVTCRNLIKFLTVEGEQNLQHHTLIDLVSNLNPFLVAELLLRIMLLCPQSRTHLDRRLALLFNHYGSFAQSELRWFIQLLEYVNLGYCTNFGTVVLPR